MREIPFEPVFARCVIYRPDQLREQAKKSNIIIPDNVNTTRHAKNKGILLKCGDTCDQKIKDAIGKEVIFARYAGDTLDEIEIDGVKIFICQDEDILGIYTGEQDARSTGTN